MSFVAPWKERYTGAGLFLSYVAGIKRWCSQSVPGRCKALFEPGLGNLEGMPWPQPEEELAMPMLARAARERRDER